MAQLTIDNSKREHARPTSRATHSQSDAAHGPSPLEDRRASRLVEHLIRSRIAGLVAVVMMVLGMLGTPAQALTVSHVVPAKTNTATTILHGVGGTVTVSHSQGNVPRGTAPAAPPLPTFTWNLYDWDPGRSWDQYATIDTTNAAATAPPAGWVFTKTNVGKLFYTANWSYTFTAVPAVGPLTATDPGTDPDPYVEVIATVAFPAGAATANNHVCTPDLPSPGQGDLGVRQPVGSAAAMANTVGLADYPIRAFSRGYDEISNLLFSETGDSTGIFFASDLYEGTLPGDPEDVGPLVLFSAPPSGLPCLDEAAGGVSGDVGVSFFNMNTGLAGSGVATDEYYFVREDDYLVEYAPIGDINDTSLYVNLDDGSGRTVSALSVEDNGTRGVFENGDYIVYAYTDSPILYVLDGPAGVPTILSANGWTFDGSATFDFTHLAHTPGAGSMIVPASITGLSIASNIANIQPVPSDRFWPDYDPAPLPAGFDDFANGNMSLFTADLGAVFDYEDDASAIGGQREVHMDVTATEGSGVFASTRNGVYLHDQSYDTFGTSEILWDGTDASVGSPGAGSLGLDLEADPSNAFVIQIDRIENYSGENDLPNIGAFVELDVPGRPRSVVTMPFSGALVTNESLILPYHLFGPDLSQVAAVGVLVDGTSTGDFVSEISRVTTTTVATYPPVIDSFDDAAVSITRSNVGSAFAYDRNPITMGGEIEISANVMASENIADLDVYTQGGALTWSQGPLVYARGSIIWDGLDGSLATNMGSSVNLTNQNAGALELRIESLSFDGPMEGGVELLFGLVSQANPDEVFYSESMLLEEPISAGETIAMPFADFFAESIGQPGTIDLSEIASVSLDIDGQSQSSFELTIGELRTTVPEPGLAASLLSGMLGLFALGRRNGAK